MAGGLARELAMPKKILGKEIYRSLEETVKPEHTALVVVDMQNDFCSDAGHWAKMGKDIAPIKAIISNLSRLIGGAREAGVPVIYLQNTQVSTGAYLSPSYIAHMLKRWDNETQLLYLLDGSWGHEIYAQIKPQEKDFVVKKHRPSGFFATDLDLILRNATMKTIVVTGVVTEGCVESTARDGWMRDYYVVIPADCVASSKQELHNAQLTLMSEIYHFVTSTEELLKVWGTGGKLGC
jgi:ureidoacrylate peracid hydrolase